jgi:hypothetical protein
MQFDHCHHNEIELVLYTDSAGDVIDADILNGTTIPKQDSIIITKAKEIHGWNATDSTGKKIKTACRVDLVYYDVDEKHTHSYSVKSERLIDGIRTTKTWSQGTITSYNKNCDNDDFFYKAGVKNFREENYADAIYNFSQAIDANPYDIDAIYNLGVAYTKKEKITKACDCFNKIKELGDNSVDEVLKKYCSGSK